MSSDDAVTVQQAKETLESAYSSCVKCCIPHVGELCSPRKSADCCRCGAANIIPVVYDISQLLDTGLDRESLAILVALIENGVNPEALAAVVKELRREAAALKVLPVCDAVLSVGGRRCYFVSANKVSRGVSAEVFQLTQPHVPCLIAGRRGKQLSVTQFGFREGGCVGLQ